MIPVILEVQRLSTSLSSNLSIMTYHSFTFFNRISWLVATVLLLFFGSIHAQPVNYCASQGDFPWHEWIAGVKIGDLDNPSGKSQYSDFTSQTINLRQGTSNPWTFTVGYSYSTYDEYLRVWVDKNLNGVFEPSENVVETTITRPPDGTPSKTIIYNSYPVDFNAPLVSGMRVRVSIKRGGYPDPCETIPFGEVEDYTMNIVAADTKSDIRTGGWEYISQWHPNGCGYAYIEPGGSAVSFAGVVINESPLAATGPFKVKSWFSNDNILSADDVLWKTTLYTGLDAKYGPHWTDGFSLSNTPVPLTLPLGIYTIIVQLDADNEVDELEETNNIFLQEGVRIGWPDFTALVTSSVPASVAPGSSFPLHFQLRTVNNFPVNQMTSSGPAAFVFLSTDNVFQSGTDVLLGSANLLYSQFNAFGEASSSITATLPPNTAPGNYFLFVVASDNCDPNAANNPSPPVALQIGAAQPCTMTAQVSNVSCSANSATATVLVTAVNGGPQGWIGSYSTPGGASFLTGQYGVAQTISVWKDLTANSVGLNFFDPVVPGCTTIAPLVCPGSGQYCTSKGDFPWEDWTSSVKIDGTEKISAKSQYSDFTGTTFILAKNTSASISLTTTYSYFTWDEYYRVWIDYNHDEFFDPATELAYSGVLAKPAPGSNVSKILNGQITVPATALDGPTRMRISQKRGAYPDPCEVFAFGEVEDYTVNIEDGGSDGADLEITLTADQTTVPIYSDVTYTYTVKNTGNQFVEHAVMFTGVCPNEVGASFYQGSGLVYAGIPAAPTVGSYNFVEQRWTINDLAPGQSGTLTIRLFTLTAAERKVIAFIQTQSPADPDSQPGTTPADCLPTQDDEAVWTINADQSLPSPNESPSDRATPEKGAEVQLYPNPAGGQVFLQAEYLAGKPCIVSLYNPLSVKVLEKHFDELPLSPVALDLSGIPTGQYFLKLETQGEQAIFRKLTVTQEY